MRSILASHRHNAAVLILSKYAHHIFNIETLSIIIEQLRQVTIMCQLFGIKFLATVTINESLVGSLLHPAVLVDSAASLIDKESLISL